MFYFHKNFTVFLTVELGLNLVQLRYLKAQSGIVIWKGNFILIESIKKLQL